MARPQDGAARLVVSWSSKVYERGKVRAGCGCSRMREAARKRRRKLGLLWSSTLGDEEETRIGAFVYHVLYITYSMQGLKNFASKSLTIF